MLGREHGKGEKLMGRDFNKLPYKSSILIHSLSSAVIVYAGLLDIYHWNVKLDGSNTLLADEVVSR